MLSVASTIRKLLSESIKVFRRFPLVFFLYQLPEVATEWVEKVGVPDKDDWLRAFLVLFPYFCIASFASTGLTFLRVRGIREENRRNVRGELESLTKGLGSLIPVSILCGIIFIFGVMALMIPGIYFQAIYLFVPFLVLERPRQPWTSYLFESKQLARQSLGLSIILGVLVMIVGLGTEIAFGVAADKFDTFPGSQLTIALVKVGCVGLGSALINIMLSLYYFSALEQRSAKTQAIPAAG